MAAMQVLQRWLLGGGWFIAASASVPAQQWGTPAPIAAPDFSVIQLDATIVMDRFGGAIAAWSQQSAGPQAAFQRVGGGWSAAQKLSGPKSFALDTTVAVGANGTAVALWVDVIPGRYGRTQMEAATLVPGGSQFSSADVLTPTDPTLSQPQVAVDGDGGVIAAWLHFDGTHRRVQVVERPAGGNWSTPFDLSSATKDAAWPRLAVDRNGHAVLAWLSTTPGSTSGRIEVALRTGGGLWSLPRGVSALTTNLWNPQVAIDATGRGAVVWEENSAIMAATQAGHRAPFMAPVQLSAVGEPSNWPSLAVDDAGHLAVAYSALLAPPVATHATRVVTRAAGASTWSAPRTLSDATLWWLEDVGPPQVAASADGSLLIVTWEDNLTTMVRAATYGAFFAGGKAWGPAQTIANDALWNDPLPVAAGPAGSARVLFANALSRYQSQLNALPLGK